MRLLSDRRAAVSLPACPLIRGGENYNVTFSRAAGYWTALDHLLRYQMGWTFPAQGLARWLDEGGGDDCEALALVRSVWVGDGHLLRYMAWRTQKNPDHVPSAWSKKLDADEYQHAREGEPIGPWQLHLEEPGGHVMLPESAPAPRLVWLHPFEPAGARSPKQPLVHDSEAVLLFRGSLESGWYGALGQSPTPRVRVISEEHGLCGRFHRSPESGRWHSAPEQFHLWGVRVGTAGSLL